MSFTDTQITTVEIGSKIIAGNQEWVITGFRAFTGDMTQYGMGFLSLRKPNGKKIYKVDLRQGMTLSSKEIV